MAGAPAAAEAELKLPIALYRPLEMQYDPILPALTHISWRARPTQTLGYQFHCPDGPQHERFSSVGPFTSHSARSEPTSLHDSQHHHLRHRQQQQLLRHSSLSVQTRKNVTRQIPIVASLRTTTTQSTMFNQKTFNTISNVTVFLCQLGLHRDCISQR